MGISCGDICLFVAYARTTRVSLSLSLRPREIQRLFNVGGIGAANCEISLGFFSWRARARENPVGEDDQPMFACTKCAAGPSNFCRRRIPLTALKHSEPHSKSCEFGRGCPGREIDSCRSPRCCRYRQPNRDRLWWRSALLASTNGNRDSGYSTVNSCVAREYVIDRHREEKPGRARVELPALVQREREREREKERERENTEIWKADFPTRSGNVLDPW